MERLASRLKRFTDRYLSWNAEAFELWTITIFTILVLTLRLGFFEQGLTDFHDRVIGAATLHMIDIGARPRLFFRNLFLVPILLFLGLQLWNRVVDYLPLERRRRFLENSSIIASFGIFIQLYSALFGVSKHCAYYLFGILLCFVGYSFLPRRSQSSRDPGYSGYGTFGWLTLCSTLFFFPLFRSMGIENPTSRRLAVSYSFLLLSMGGIGYLVSYLLRHSPRRTCYLNIMCESAMLGGSALLIVPVVASELYYILNAHGVYFLTPKALGIIMVAATLGRVSVRSLRLIRGSIDSGRGSVEGGVLVPCLLITLVGYVHYQHFFTVDISQWSEAGNAAIPVQQFFEFGKIPILENFPPHLASDFLWFLVYHMVYGWGSADLLPTPAYDFMWVALSFVLVYVLLRRILSPKWIVLPLLLLSPNLNILLAGHYYTFGLLPILVLLGIDGRGDVGRESGRFFALWSAVATLCLYRLDLGVAAAITSLVTYIVISLACSYPRRRHIDFTKGLLLSLFVGVTTLATLCQVVGVSFSERIEWLRGIVALEGQSNVLPSLFAKFSPGVFISYYAIPSLVGCMLVLCLRKVANGRQSNRSVLLVIIYACIFYYSVYVRALYRHGWREEGVTFIYSLFPLAITLLPFSFQKLSRSQMVALALSLNLVVTGSIVVGFNRVRVSNGPGRSLLFNALSAYRRFELAEPRGTRILRTRFTNNGSEKYEPFKRLVDRVLDKNETFLVFNNKDFLYAVTRREYPTYMLQVPMGYSNDRMQRLYLRTIQRYNAPFLVFSGRQVGSAWDRVDGVDNAIRGYRLAEYFYDHYTPMAFAGSYFVWARNDSLRRLVPVVEQLQGEFGKREYEVVREVTQQTYLKYLPFIWGNFDSERDEIKKQRLQTLLPESMGGLILRKGEVLPLRLEPDLDTSQAKYLYFRMRGKKDATVWIYYDEHARVTGTENAIWFDMKKDKKYRDYLVRVSCQWKWHQEIEYISIRANRRIEIEAIDIVAGEGAE